MPLPSSDAELHLRRALRLAGRGRYRVAPNPRVGAVLVRQGTVVGEGWHRRVGAPHAEVEALRAAGGGARGATLYVTLEPCAHQGRTPPCTEAILAAGVERVVACHRDPNRVVKGGGLERLAAAGVRVQEGILVEEAVRLNLAFLTFHLERRPAVTLKWAMSADGRIATARGESQWISSPRGRQWALELREEHDAVLVGSGTVLADDPRLDRRLGRALAANLRVVMDRRLRLQPTHRIFDGPGQVLVYTASSDARRRRALEEVGAEVALLDTVTPQSVVANLGERQVQSVLVEGGSTLLGAFGTAGVWDRVAICWAPLLIGGRHAPGPLGGTGVEELAAAPEIEDLRVRRRGRDVILDGLRKGCLRGLSTSVAG